MKIKKSNAELEQKLEQIKTLIKQKIELPSKTSYAIIKNKIAIERAFCSYYVTADRSCRPQSTYQGIGNNELQNKSCASRRGYAAVGGGAFFVRKRDRMRRMGT